MPPEPSRARSWYSLTERGSFAKSGSILLPRHAPATGRDYRKPRPRLRRLLRGEPVRGGYIGVKSRAERVTPSGGICANWNVIERRDLLLLLPDQLRQLRTAGPRFVGPSTSAHSP